MVSIKDYTIHKKIKFEKQSKNSMPNAKVKKIVKKQQQNREKLVDNLLKAGLYRTKFEKQSKNSMPNF